ncbi:MAG: NADH-quinone oxidoreductase subunit M [Chloroflexota bacterium]
MTETGFSLLTLVMTLPLAGVLLLAVVPRTETKIIKWITLFFTALTFLVSLQLFTRFDSDNPGFQFVEHVAWIPSLNINYHVGLDGMSLFIVLLSTLLSMLAVGASWNSITERVREYMMLMLIMETAMIGVFVALDMFLFYIFWEASLIPMALLIAFWGGNRKTYAAIKFTLYTFIASALMLVSIIVLYIKGGTSYVPDLFGLQLSESLQIWLFFGFALAFAVKVPVFPFHTWLPTAHVQAPTAGSILLAGVLLKMGTYGFLRFANPLLPLGFAYWAPLLSVLAVIGIIYGALIALVQEDVKSLVAYSSVAHMGFIVLGIFSGGLIGTGGAVMQMINHGLSTGALFMLVGVIYERRHTRLMKDYGGIFAKVPIFGAFFLVAVFSSVGLPGLNGFVGEFVILLGTFNQSVTLAVFGTFGIILAAWYLLTATRRVLFGPFNTANENLTDMDAREILTASPLIVLFFVLGFFPNIIFDRINASTEALYAISQGEQPAVSQIAE